jgi:hypothetical protein
MLRATRVPMVSYLPVGLLNPSRQRQVGKTFHALTQSGVWIPDPALQGQNQTTYFRSSIFLVALNSLPIFTV